MRLFVRGRYRFWRHLRFRYWYFAIGFVLFVFWGLTGAKKFSEAIPTKVEIANGLLAEIAPLVRTYSSAKSDSTGLSNSASLNRPAKQPLLRQPHS